MSTIQLQPCIYPGKFDKKSFLAALKLNRKMNVVSGTEFKFVKDDDGLTYYNCCHKTPALFKTFINIDNIYQNEVINSRLPNQISITALPLDETKLPYMKTNTIYIFSPTELRIICEITFKLFKNKVPKLIQKAIDNMAIKKSTMVRKYELETYNGLQSIKF